MDRCLYGKAASNAELMSLGFCLLAIMALWFLIFLIALWYLPTVKENVLSRFSGCFIQERWSNLSILPFTETDPRPSPIPFRCLKVILHVYPSQINGHELIWEWGNSSLWPLCLLPLLPPKNPLFLPALELHLPCSLSLLFHCAQCCSRFRVWCNSPVAGKVRLATAACIPQALILLPPLRKLPPLSFLNCVASLHHYYWFTENSPSLHCVIPLVSHCYSWWSWRKRLRITGI